MTLNLINIKDSSSWKETNDGRDAAIKDFKFWILKSLFHFIYNRTEIEEINHHAEIENVYNKARITLTTHDLVD